MICIRTAVVVTTISLLFAGIATAADPAGAYTDEIAAWRARADSSLRADRGWLTLVGRHVLRPGESRIGAGADNDVVLPAEVSPPHLGTITAAANSVRLRLAPGITMTGKDPFTSEAAAFTERELGTSPELRDWVERGRLAMHVIAVEDRRVLRVADNASARRAQFAGRVWYPVDPAWRLPAKFVAYDPPRPTEIVNVLGEISTEPMVGYVEFEAGGKRQRLDAIGEDDGTLWFILRDATAGNGSYPAGRFLVAPKPVDGQTTVDFNRAHNPPCAFSDFTTCPLPPPQNQLAVPIAAGERYVPMHK